MADHIPRRVHIAPQGFEDDRIALPAIDRDADIVVLIEHDGGNATAQRCRERIIDALDEEGIEHNSITCDLFDLNDAIETILAAIRDRNPDDNIRVNISAGSKITAIAGMLACMFTSADPYYVVPEGYHETDDDIDRDTVSHGKEETKMLPAYPVTKPDLQLVQVLAFIEEEQPDNPPAGVQLKEIGRYLLEQDLPAVEGSDKQPEEAEDIYPIVNERIVDPLHNRGLIKKTRLKGATQIRTSQEGQEMLALAESLIGERDGT